MNERNETLAEFYQCNCAFACDCEVDAREHMADTIASLRRELVSAYSARESALKERDDTIAICRGNQLTDSALASMRKYVEENIRIEADLKRAQQAYFRLAREQVEKAYMFGLADGPMWHDHAIAPSVLWPASEAYKLLEEL